MSSVTRGRRPAGSGTRESILEAARQLFADLGYDRTSLRAVASAAGVDVGLVAHYFGPKQRLFVEAAGLPFDPEALLPTLLEGPREEIGRRLAEHVLRTVSDPQDRRQLVALVRAAASEEAAADVIRERVTREFLLPLAEGLGVPDAPLRAALAGSQVVGLVMVRHVIGITPLADAPADVLVRAIAPVLQHYLTGAI